MAFVCNKDIILYGEDRFGQAHYYCMNELHSSVLISMEISFVATKIAARLNGSAAPPS